MKLKTINLVDTPPHICCAESGPMEGRMMSATNIPNDILASALQPLIDYPASFSTTQDYIADELEDRGLFDTAEMTVTAAGRDFLTVYLTVSPKLT